MILTMTVIVKIQITTVTITKIPMKMTTRCCLSFFSLVCCSALAGGFYGNHQVFICGISMIFVVIIFVIIIVIIDIIIIMFTSCTLGQNTSTLR